MEFVVLLYSTKRSREKEEAEQVKKNKYKKKGEQPRLFYEHHKIIL